MCKLLNPSATLTSSSVSEDQSIFAMPPWCNMYLIAADSLSLALHFLILYIPVLSVSNSLFVTPLTQPRAGPFPARPSQLGRGTRSTEHHCACLNIFQWQTVLLLSVPVILIDEALKLYARLTSGLQLNTREIGFSRHQTGAPKIKRA